MDKNTLLRILDEQTSLTEEEKNKVIDVLSDNWLETEIDDDDKKLLQELKEKYIGKYVYFNRYEGGGWICNVEDIVLDDCYFYFKGNRIQFETVNTKTGGDGLVFIAKGFDNGAEFDPDYDTPAYTNVISKDDAIKECKRLFEWSMCEMFNEFVS